MTIPSALAGFLLGLSLFLVGTPANAQSSPELKLTRCPDMRGRGECGRLVVAENPAASEGRSIGLNLVRIPALAAAPEPDPVFVLVGGPGEAATDLRHQLPALFRRLNRQRDIVLVDQRGTGKSNPLHCELFDELDFGLPSRESIPLQIERMRECLDGFDADLRFYTTPFFVDDIDAVRRALGYEKINLWGGSYGSRAALVYLRRHPHSVRAVILDSVAPFDIQLPLHAQADADNALKQLLDHCRKLSSCSERFGDLEEKTRSLISQLDAVPQMLELEHPLRQKPLQVYMDGQVLSGLIRLGLYQRELSPLLPLALDAAHRDDFRPLMVLLMLSEEIGKSLSLGLQQTILCAEDITRPWPALEHGESSILELNLLSHLSEQCRGLPQGELPENYFEPVQSDLPVLLLSGELDPVTPPRWADVAAQTLANSRHIRVAGGHHIVSHLGCVRHLAEEFIEKGHHDDLPVDCLSNIQPLPPFISPAGPAMKAEGGE